MNSIGNAPFITGSPAVALFAANYVPSHSVRADLNWTGVISSAVTFSVRGMEAVNTNMPEAFDANFNGQQRFSLTNEGGRPVYVQTASIVPATGAVASSESRVPTRFAQVSERRSNGQSHTGSMTAQLNVQQAYDFTSSVPAGSMSIAYTYTDTRSFVNGFVTTDGDPRGHEWSSASTSRHNVIVSSVLRVPTWATFVASVNVQSGVAYTPRVGGDVNGDGYANDRAFVFDPAAAPDPAVAAGIRSLLTSAPNSARDCLRRQLGAIAEANSCTGPWTAALNLSAGLDAFRLGFKNRGSVTLTLKNALGAADQLLHGDARLHGWGQSAFPDPTLLNVRGFDPSARRFIYDVNPQFGGTTLSRAGYRAPFSLVLDARLSFRASRERGYIDNIAQIVVDSGQVDVEKLKVLPMRIGNGTKPPLDCIFSEKTKLGLSDEQVSVLSTAGNRYNAERGRIYADLAKYVAGLNKGYDEDALVTYYHRAAAAVLAAQGDFGATLRSTMTPAQLNQALSTGLIQPGNGYYLYDRAMLNRQMKGQISGPP